MICIADKVYRKTFLLIQQIFSGNSTFLTVAKLRFDIAYLKHLKAGVLMNTNKLYSNGSFKGCLVICPRRCSTLAERYIVVVVILLCPIILERL